MKLAEHVLSGVEVGVGGVGVVAVAPGVGVTDVGVVVADGLVAGGVGDGVSDRRGAATVGATVGAVVGAGVAVDRGVGDGERVGDGPATTTGGAGTLMETTSPLVTSSATSADLPSDSAIETT